MTQYVYPGQGELLPFKYLPLKEDIFITGKKGEGKTVREKLILDKIQHLPYWIWCPENPIEKFGNYAHVVRRIEDMKYGQYVYAGADFSMKAFIKFCQRVLQMQNMVIVWDDIHKYVKKQSAPDEFKDIILSKRNQGISSIYSTTTPKSITNEILGNCTHVFAYKFQLESDAEWLAKNFFGPEAWLLVAKDRRKKGFFDSPDDITILPPYGYIYRRDDELETKVVIPS